MKAVHVSFSGEWIVVELDDQRLIRLPIAWPRLLLGDAEARRNVVISANGQHLHWPDLDEDLSVPALVRRYQELQPEGFFALASETNRAPLRSDAYDALRVDEHQLITRVIVERLRNLAEQHTGALRQLLLVASDDLAVRLAREKEQLAADDVACTVGAHLAPDENPPSVITLCDKASGAFVEMIDRQEHEAPLPALVAILRRGRAQDEQAALRAQRPTPTAPATPKGEVLSEKLFCRLAKEDPTRLIMVLQSAPPMALPSPLVASVLESLLDHPDAVVREGVIYGLTPHIDANDPWTQDVVPAWVRKVWWMAKSDPSRGVRTAAAGAIAIAEFDRNHPSLEAPHAARP